MAIKKRKALTSKYVTIEPDGSLNVKTPPDCVMWPTEFLLRMSKFWIKPGTLMKMDVFRTNYIDNGWSTKIYRINGRKLRILYLVSQVARPAGMVCINATAIQDEATLEGIELTHPEFVFRNLQVYEFATRQELGGVPRPKRLVVKNTSDDNKEKPDG